MYYKSRKNEALRNRLKDLLITYGWSEECGWKRMNGKYDADYCYKSPHIDSLYFERNLMHVNNYAPIRFEIQTYASELPRLAWRCNQNNPNNHYPLDTLDAFGYARSMMLNGIEYNRFLGREEGLKPGTPEESYKGTIQVMNWWEPERNIFELVDCHQGALPDGFGWDLILKVNSIPLCGVVIEADDKDSQLAPCQKALELAQTQLDADFQFPVYCHMLIISNGKKMMWGDPYMDIQEFKEIEKFGEFIHPVSFMERIEDFGNWNKEQ